MIYPLAAYDGPFTDDDRARVYRSLHEWWRYQGEDRQQVLRNTARHLPLQRLIFWSVRVYRSHPAILKGLRMSVSKPQPIRRQITTSGFFYWEPVNDPLVITVGELLDIVEPGRRLGT